VTRWPSSQGNSTILAEIFALMSTFLTGSISPGALTYSVSFAGRTTSIRTGMGLPPPPAFVRRYLSTPSTTATVAMTVRTIVVLKYFLTSAPFREKPENRQNTGDPVAPPRRRDGVNRQLLKNPP